MQCYKWPLTVVYLELNGPWPKTYLYNKAAGLKHKDVEMWPLAEIHVKI